MEEAQANTYTQLLADLVKKYNSNKKVIQIKITIGRSKYVYMIKGRQSSCHIVFDPLREVGIDDLTDSYICYTEEELKQIIDHMIKNYDTFVTYKPNSDDVYDQPDLKIISYTDAFDECFEHEEE